ncbi:hypothetical protein D3C77_513230 [compost metagenome]
MAPPPVRVAQSNPVPIQRKGRRLICASTHWVPATMYWRMKATDITRPATNPPPGWLCPRMNRYIDTTRAIGSSRRTNTAGTIMKPRAVSAAWRGLTRSVTTSGASRRCWAGSCMLSRGGRKRRSRANTASATATSTVTSPRVSKPRKSTSMTLTTLLPPPSGRARLR